MSSDTRSNNTLTSKAKEYDIVRHSKKLEKCLTNTVTDSEDRVKQHFMIPLDPEHVKKMLDPSYDPHIDIAMTSGVMTEAEGQMYKDKSGTEEQVAELKTKRHKGKTVNYSSVYNVGANTLSRTLDIEIKEAEKLLEAYWSINWAVKAIAEEQNIIETENNGRWLINPINGFLYSLRSDKDRFSTLCQGTGAFFFDMWVDKILTKMEDKWGKKTLTGQFHDELIIVCKDNPKAVNVISNMITSSIKEVSDEYKLRRELGADVQTGYRYANIH